MELRTHGLLTAVTKPAVLALTVAQLFACGGDEEPTNVEISELPALVERDWNYLPVEGTFCRNGSTAGYTINPSSGSKNIMIYLEGGGACFDEVSCAINPGAVLNNGRPLGVNTAGSAPEGVWDRNNPENPVGDWNFVYVPYCTGDVHIGANPDGMIGSQRSMFVGYTNISLILKELRKRFPKVENVLVTGISAGGFGAPANVPQIMRAFPEAKGTLIDDSGPGMSSKYLASCLQEKWRTAWNLDESLLKECGTDCPNKNDYILDFSQHLARATPNQTGGLIEATGDTVIRTFFSAGRNNCEGGVLGGILGGSVPVEEFKAGLLEFREATKQNTNFGTYYIESTQHTWLASNSFYTHETAGVRLVDWFKGILTGESVTHVGP